MTVIIRIPTTLRPLTAGQPEVEVDAGTVGEAIAALDAAHPGFTSRILDESGALRRFVNVFVSTSRILDESGALRRFVNVFVSDDDVRFLDGLDTAVPEGGTVAIVPAVAGG